MKLTTKVKQKNDQLLLQRAKLQQQLHDRLNTQEFSSFFITFAVAPFCVAAIAMVAVVPKKSIPRRLSRALFLGLKLLPLSLPFPRL